MHIAKLPRIYKFIDQYQKKVVSICLEVYFAGSKNLEDKYIPQKRWQLYSIKLQLVTFLGRGLRRK